MTTPLTFSAGRSTPWRALLFCAFFVLAGLAPARAQQSPLLIRSAATTTLDTAGRPWAYVVLNENTSGLLTGRTLAVYQKNGLPDSAATFTYRGLIAPTNDPTACGVMLQRAQSIGDNPTALDVQLTALHRLLINDIDSSNPPTIDPPPLALNRRLSAVLSRAAGDARLTQMLGLMGLVHPAVRLARGTAWAGPLQVPVGSDVTLEIRERDATGADSAVIARVSLRAGQPDLLPAPGPLAIVPDSTAGGDLTIKLRWATPNPLRAAGMQHNGDLAWRVSRSYAEANGFQNSPPAGATLDALALSNPADVKRVAGPIFPSKLFSAVDVADFTSDPATVYLSDNNDRNATGGVPMAEGAQAYYFVAGADALGRPGAVSPGVLAMFCTRVPPHVPTRLAVKSVSSQGAPQYLDVSWLTNLPGDGTSTTRYEIYRGKDLALLAAAQRGDLNLDAAPPIIAGNPDAIKRIAVVTDPSVNPAQILHQPDDGGGPNKFDPWWFAIRAVHAGPPGMGDLASVLGPPAFGALRNRIALPAPATNPPPAIGECLRVACMRDRFPATVVSTDPPDSSVLHFKVQCSRRNGGVVAAHVRVMDGAAVVVPETVLVFPEIEDTASQTDDTVEFSWTYPLALASHQLTVQCRAEAVGTVDANGGAMSAWATSSAGGLFLAGNQFVLHHFLAGVISETERQQFIADALWSTLGPPGPGECMSGSDVHFAYSSETGRIFAPHVCLPLSPGAAQYRIYRRVDDGPLTLIEQGEQYYTPGGSVCVDDPAPPTSNGRVVYFGQMLDVHGHAGAMLRLGSLRFTGYKPPTPVLFSPKPTDITGTLASPTVTLRWTCPPEHVGRFEVYFSTSNPSSGMGSIPGSGISAQASLLLRKPAIFPTVHKVADKLSRSDRRLIRIDDSFLTGPVGGVLGAGPVFSVTMTVNPNLRYQVWLRALGTGGECGDASSKIEFSWVAPAGPLPSIAWPARSLPPVAAFNPGIVAVDFNDIPKAQRFWGIYNPNGLLGFRTDSVDVFKTPVGIRVGSVTASETTQQFDNDSFHGFGLTGTALALTPGLSTVFGRADPNTQLYRHATDLTQSLLPFVLYRQQVASAVFPVVSGDVIQASPLISKVASRLYYSPDQIVGAELADPFFRWVRNDPDANTHATDLYLVDTQPVVTGAAYRYWLTRFNNLGEPIQTIPCGTVTVKTAP